MWCQFLKFKETELPAKEADKNRSKGIFQSLEVRGCPGRREQGRCRGSEALFGGEARASWLSCRDWSCSRVGRLGGPGRLGPSPPELGPCPQAAVQAGQLKVPPGYHPLDVEKEWGKLHVAILEREKQLRGEFERWVGAGLGGQLGGGGGAVAAATRG